jgi:hypothetical protein
MDTKIAERRVIAGHPGRVNARDLHRICTSRRPDLDGGTRSIPHR